MHARPHACASLFAFACASVFSHRHSHTQDSPGQVLSEMRGMVHLFGRVAAILGLKLDADMAAMPREAVVGFGTEMSADSLLHQGLIQYYDTAGLWVGGRCQGREGGRKGGQEGQGEIRFPSAGNGFNGSLNVTDRATKSRGEWQQQDVLGRGGVCALAGASAAADEEGLYLHEQTASADVLAYARGLSLGLLAEEDLVERLA